VLAIGYCEGHELRFPTSNMPPSFSCAEASRSDAESFSIVRNQDHNVLVSSFPLNAGGRPGHLVVLHDLTRPAISQHLSVLKEAGLVSERRNCTRRLYRARPQGLVELKAFLEEFWDERLEALKREAEQEERSTHGQDG